MLLKSRGCRMQQYAKISSSNLRLIKLDTRKVWIFMRIASLFTHNLSLLVIHQCALQRDLELFEAGDATEVGERGLTLRCGILFIPSHRRYPLMV